jgi:serine/threonine protein kinase/formylglycine-generating enzyme required for sulfatase activity
MMDERRLGEGGRYELRTHLGAGAIGNVTLAYDHRMQRFVAIKELSQALARNPRVRARFKNEALIQGDIVHENVVRALDVIEEGETLAIAMDFVDGTDVDGLLERSGGRMEWPAVKALMPPIFAGVAAAHRKGIIHRDLKPANILVDRSSGSDVPRVTDFGIAKIVGSAEGLTREGAVMGTPAYMSPEQLLGAADLDARTDVYALGAIVYRLLCGAPPHEGTSEYAITHKVLSQTPLRPVSELAPGLPSALDRWLARAMAFERTARFDSVDEMAKALACVEDDVSPTEPQRHAPAVPAVQAATPNTHPAAPPVQATTPNTPPASDATSSASESPATEPTPPAVTPEPAVADSMRPPPRRRRAPATVAAVLVLAGLGVGGWRLYRGSETSAQTTEAAPAAPTGAQLAPSVTVAEPTPAVAGVAPVVARAIPTPPPAPAVGALPAADLPVAAGRVAGEVPVPAPPSAAPSAPQLVSLSVTVNADDVVLRIDGDTSSYAAPDSGQAVIIMVPRGDQPRKVVASKAGHADAAAWVTPTTNVSIVLELPVPALAAVPPAAPAPEDAVEPGIRDMVEVPSGEVHVGTSDASVRLARCQKLDKAKSCTAAIFADELPATTVVVASFVIDRTEVTSADYAKCVAVGRCSPPRYDGQGSRYPVTGVSFNDAKAFCAWANARLPSDLEWEAAARAGGTSLFPWGDELPNETRGNICDAGCSKSWRFEGWRDAHPSLAPVHSYPGGDTPSGIADLCGNVWEWVESSSGSSVVRGGSYLNAPANCEASVRVPLSRQERRHDIGFRCARRN